MKIFFYLIFVNILFLSSSKALIEVDITRGNLDPLPIAVSPLHVDIKSEKFKDLKIKNLGEDIAKIIEQNFDNSRGILVRLSKHDVECEDFSVFPKQF